MVAVVLLDALDLLARAEDERNALVQLGRGDVEHALASGGRAAARLLDDERDRVGLIEEAKAARLCQILRVARVEEHAAPRQDTVRLRDERGHPAHVEVLAARTC